MMTESLQQLDLKGSILARSRIEWRMKRASVWGNRRSANTTEDLLYFLEAKVVTYTGLMGLCHETETELANAEYTHLNTLCVNS